MPVYRSQNGTFYSQCFYRDRRSAKRHKVKRGFSTELETLIWEKDFLSCHSGTMEMIFADFVGGVCLRDQAAPQGAHLDNQGVHNQGQDALTEI